MPYSVEKLPNEPVVLSILHADHPIAAEGEKFLNDIFKALDAQDEPVYLVIDLSTVPFSLEEMIQGVSMVTQQHKLFKHPNMLETVAVTSSWLMKIAAKGINTPILSNVNICVFETYSAALAYICSQRFQNV